MALLEDIQHAIKERDTNTLIALAKYLSKEEAPDALRLYEEYYNHEASVAREVQNLLARLYARKIRWKVPTVGSYTYNLED